MQNTKKLIKSNRLLKEHIVKMAKIDFVEYTGKYPCLCSGILVLKIDGREYVFNGKRVNGKLEEIKTFGAERDFDENGELKTGIYTSFWISGGSVIADENWDFTVETGEWDIIVSKLPEELRPYAKDIADVFNENVDYGCCGGCI